MFKKIIESFIPNVPATDSERQRRLRLIAYALFITIIFSLFYVAVSWMAGFTLGMLFMFCAAIVFTVLLILLRKGVDIFIIANLFGFTGIIAIALCIYYSGGLNSPVLPWLATTPIVILLLAGKKSGSFWAIVSVVIIVMVTVTGSLGFVFPKAFSTGNLEFALSCNAGLVLLIFFISIVFENVSINAFNIVSSKNDELQQTLDELKATQSQLIQSEKMASLGELTAGIAHEIQNPLNFINNFSAINVDLADDLLKALEQNNIEEAFNLIHDIKGNAQKVMIHGNRADSIVKGMLQHSRKSTGIKKPTDINALCEECSKLSFHGLRAKDKSFNSAFKTTLDPDAGKINIIPQDISRVLLNLLNNAFYTVNERYKTEGESFKPMVSINTKKIQSSAGNYIIEIRVSDNGSGIPQTVMNKIFQPFFTTKPTGQGTGLGLSLSYDIIKAHNGTIKAQTQQNVGTDFIIQLPYA